MLEKIKILLGINDTSKDKLINVLIEQYQQQIKNSCSLIEFPIELEAVVVDLIVEKSRNETKVASRGSVSFQHQVSETDLDKYESQLSKFRRIRVL